MHADSPDRVLLVETDENILEMLLNTLAFQGCQTVGERDLEAALKHTEQFTVIVLGNLGPHDRADAFKRLRERHPRASVWDLLGGCT